MNDELGTRIKENYENRTRYYVPRRTYTLLRLDQKAGHTYTRGLNKPFDKGYMEDMDAAVIAMLPEIQGTVFAYLQSDEYSILLTDFATPQTSAWFDGNIQKMSSVAASIMTAEFNKQRLVRNLYGADIGGVKNVLKLLDMAYFDCRCFSIPDRIEVMNYFRWRQQDCIRNSVSMVAQSHFSSKELHGKSQADMHEMLHQKDVNWATDFTDGEKNGRIIVKESYVSDDFVLESIDMLSDGSMGLRGSGTTRTRWVSKGAWVFTKDEGKLLEMIPQYE